jgi:hypothetical protein
MQHLLVEIFNDETIPCQFVTESVGFFSGDVRKGLSGFEVENLDAAANLGSY